MSTCYDLQFTIVLHDLLLILRFVEMPLGAIISVNINASSIVFGMHTTMLLYYNWPGAPGAAAAAAASGGEAWGRLVTLLVQNGLAAMLELM
jgi:hypothetical protein